MASAEAGQRLSDAAFAGDIAKMEELLASGIPVDTRDNDGFTALHRSCVTGKVPVIQFLISKGASVNAEDSYGDSPLHYACFCGHLEAVRVLVGCGGDMHRPSKDGKTPLQSAKEEGHTTVVSYLTGPGMPAGPEAPLKPAPPPRAPAPPSAPRSGSAPAPPAAAVAPPPPAGGGLDFTRGVILEGELSKKRANKMMKWRKKYYVLSRVYGALFFWTGNRTRVEGVIKKVRFETFLTVSWFPDKQGGKRFELRVITGRSMQLLASSPEEAKRWVETLKSVLGPSMSAIRIQSVWRGYRARKLRRKLLAERSAAVAKIAKQAGGSVKPATPAKPGAASAALTSPGGAAASGAAASASKAGAAKSAHKRDAMVVGTVIIAHEGILLEGELKKKNHAVMSSFLAGYRTRYFVLSAHDARLYYFDSKAQRSLGQKARLIPFLNFYSVTHLLDRKGAKSKVFTLKTVAGTVYVLESRSVEEATKWVTALLSVLPKENAAAIKLQSAFRMFRWRRLYKAARAAKAAGVSALATKYGKPLATLQAAAIKICAVLRGWAARRKYLRVRAARREAEAAAAAAAGGSAGAAGGSVKPKWLALKHGTSTSNASGASPSEDASSASARLAKLRELRSLRAAAGEFTSPWVRYEDATTGKPYWHNPTTGETSWNDPTLGDWREVLDASSGKTYYFNSKTNETTWTRPKPVFPKPVAPSAGAAEKEKRAPMPRWIRQADPATGKEYFANVDTGETSWTEPAAIAAGTARLITAPWFSKIGDDGKKYYVSSTTGATQWERPDGYESDADSPTTDARSVWVEVQDPVSGKPYYYHRVTGERSWNCPWAAPTATVVVEDVVAGAKPIFAASDVPRSGSSSSTPTPPSRSRSGSSTPAGAAGALSRRASRRATTTSLASPARGAAATDWEEHVDASSNRTYYYNTRTGESSWSKPDGFGAHEAAAEEAPVAVSYDANELMTFTLFVNQMLEADADEGVRSRVPLLLEAEPPALFSATRDGVLLCHLVNAVAPGALDLRVVDHAAKVPSASVRKASRLSTAASARGSVALGQGPVGADGAGALDNCRLALSAAQGVGAIFNKETSPAALVDGDPPAVLEFVWQCLKLRAVNSITPRAGIPGIAALAADGESPDEFLFLDSSALVMRWVNYQLAAAGSARSGKISSLGASLADGVALCAIARTVAADYSADVPATDDAAVAAGAEAAVTAALSAAFAVGVPAIFTVEGVTGGNPRLQLALLAELLRCAPHLEQPPAPAAAAAAATGQRPSGSRTATAASASATATAGAKSTRVALEAALASRAAGGERETDAAAVTRETNLVSQWINALDIESVFVRPGSLAADLKDGVALLKIMEKVEPGIVNWSRANSKPTNRYKMVENCNYIINLGRAMDFTLVNVSGLDIVEGNPKLLLALLWQLMRYYTMKQLSAMAFDGFDADEGEILRWANDRVAEAAMAAGTSADGADFRIASFSDPTLSTGVYLLYLLNAVRPNVVDWSGVGEAEFREEKLRNAGYVLSLARRLGAQVFLAPEDIAEVRSRQIMLLVASIMMVANANARATAARPPSDSVTDEHDGLRGRVADDSGSEAGDDDDDDHLEADDSDGE